MRVQPFNVICDIMNTSLLQHTPQHTYRIDEQDIEETRETDMADSSIIIYGQTIFCLSLYALLVEKLPDESSDRIICVSSLPQLLDLPFIPKVIFAERNGRDDIFHLPVSHRHIPVLTLDIGTGDLRINSQESLNMDTLVDLVNVIMQFTSVNNPHAPLD